ncbi:hypothetical protein FNV43_RR01618 [Rhamnella rubrinervis]|uniref:Uncharacterized protein n=1 Tax=Rhamnella rubrinervis TaxID=2594499 RepID=A0A8K0HPZ1_9ROSA|nr:hypothetical protein FNV43_RR01618 [Rhamnella rubrinervis]
MGARRVCPRHAIGASAWHATGASGNDLPWAPGCVSGCARRGKTNFVSRRSKPDSVPYWWVNNPTLGELASHDRKKRRRIKSSVAMSGLAATSGYPVAPTYTTPLKSFHKVGLESSSARVFFPADYAKRSAWRGFIWIRSDSLSYRLTVFGLAGRPGVPIRPARRGDQLARGAASAVHRGQRVGAQDPCRPRANPFRGSGSILPTSHLHCSIDRYIHLGDDAVMSAAVAGTRSSGFQGRGLPDTSGVAVLFRPLDPTSGGRFGVGGIKRKDNSSRPARRLGL